MFNGNSPSLADIAAVTGNNRNNDGMFGGDGWWAIIIFAMIFGWGGNGFGGFGGNGGNALTQSELQRGFDNQSVMNKLNGIEQGLCNGFYSTNTGVLQGFNGVERDLCQGFNGVNSAIANLGYQNQQCCCETNRNIDAVRYENAKNTCDIVNAIKADGDATRALMTQNEIQKLRDDLQTAQFQLSQQAQSSNIINQLQTKPPVAAYLTCSPYQSQMLPYAFGFNNNCGFERFDNGCGCRGCC